MESVLLEPQPLDALNGSQNAASKIREASIKDIGKPRVIVVGGGFAGMEVVKRLAQADVQVVLFDKNNHHTFQPLLYQVATSALESSAIIFPFRRKFKAQLDFYYRYADVLQVHPKTSEIETSIGTVKYDILILACGATSNHFGNLEFEKYSLPLKSIEDAIALRNRILRNTENALLTKDSVERNSLLDYVIVGGGPTGVELAGAMAELKNHVFPFDYKELDIEEMDIHLVEAGPRLLPAMSPKSSDRTLQYLKELGVMVHLNTKITSYDGQVATFDSLPAIPTKSLIWAAGVKGNPVKGLHPNCYQPNGRILVNKFNQVKMHPNIFVIGDLSLMKTTTYPNGHPMIAPVAIAQGKHLGNNINDYFLGNQMKPFQYKDKGAMATIGRNKAVVEMKKLTLGGRMAWLLWLLVHLLSMANFKSRLSILVGWFNNYLSYEKTNRFIIGKNFGPEPN